ncbi:hypothetical protein K1719_044142 [Acacia pycnantha]|nr:hypothetical protein K1719_044142 [Acacia pycnantha]
MNGIQCDLISERTGRHARKERVKAGSVPILSSSTTPPSVPCFAYGHKSLFPQSFHRIELRGRKEQQQIYLIIFFIKKKTNRKQRTRNLSLSDRVLLLRNKSLGLHFPLQRVSPSLSSSQYYWDLFLQQPPCKETKENNLLIDSIVSSVRNVVRCYVVINSV